MYDAIVIGARVAGAPTAMLLAREGHKVLLADRATFPSDTMSTHLTQPPTIVRLRKWGLLDRLLDQGLPKLRPMRMDFGEIQAAGRDFGHVTVEGTPEPLDDVDWYLAPRRTYLDGMLVEAAVEAGAELREGVAVQELVWDGDRVSGVRFRDGTVEHAKLVVGADGLNSSVAKEVGAEKYQEGPSLTVGYYAYWSGVEDTRASLTVRPGQTIAEFPTHDEQTCINVSWPIAEFKRVRKDIENEHAAAIRKHAPDLAERMAGAHQDEKFKGSAVVPNFFRTPFGPGWALVGDAGYHKDPIGGHGIMDALRDAELLAEAAHEGLSGEKPMEEALAGYQQTRDMSATPLYYLNMKLAEMDPTEDMLATLGAIVAGGDEGDVRQFLGIMAGTVPVIDFFQPENLERILQQADVPTSVLEQQLA